jgi:methyl-accepting chemotaxis protein
VRSSIRLKLLGSFLTVIALMAALGVVALERLGAAEAAARADGGGANVAVHDAIVSGRTWTLALLALGVVVALVLAYLLGRSIAGGLRELLAAASGIAAGDVRQRVELRAADEIGQTADAFRAMVAYLDEMATAARGIADGDLTVRVEPKSERDALGGAFAAMSAQLREALGDRSCLDALVQRMDSMSSHCMIDLESALKAAQNGDLTVTVTPVTAPLVAADGDELGRLGAIFNEMLGRAQGSIDAYNAMRARVAEMLRQISRESQAVASASQQMASTAEESGRAVGEIANAVNEVATGAERQVRTVDQARALSEEVRKLAEESQEAAASISALIEEIQRETGTAVERVEAGGEQIGRGVATVEEARGSFELIGSSVEDMNVRVERIAVAIEQIAQSTEGMGGRMAEVVSVAEQSSASTQQVSASTQQSSAATQEVAASAQQLARTAEELERLVGQFRLAAT